MKRKAYLAINCPKSGTIKPFTSCERCSFKEYNSLTAYAVDCGYREFIDKVGELNG